jgi:DUF4097 and DUF4098 domain-containing protein YvlB
MTRKFLFLPVTVLSLFLIFALSAAHAATEIFDETYQVKPGTRLELRNQNGPVTVQGWGQPDVRVTAEKKTRWGGKLEDVEIRVTVGETMTIETIHLVKNPKVSVTYDVRVPTGVIVGDVRTSNGKIEINGTQGNATVETSNGKIEIEHVRGDIEARTSNGKIEMEDVHGWVRAETSNGRIEIENVAGIQNLETSNGSIVAEIPAMHEDVRVRTSNGSLELHLSPDLSVDIELRTSNGKIAVRDLEIVTSEISETKLKGKIGNGGPTLHGKTSNGSIEILRLD